MTMTLIYDLTLVTFDLFLFLVLMDKPNLELSMHVGLCKYCEAHATENNKSPKKKNLKGKNRTFFFFFPSILYVSRYYSYVVP